MRFSIQLIGACVSLAFLTISLLVSCGHAGAERLNFYDYEWQALDGNLLYDPDKRINLGGGIVRHWVGYRYRDLPNTSLTKPIFVLKHWSGSPRGYAWQRETNCNDGTYRRSRLRERQFPSGFLLIGFYDGFSNDSFEWRKLNPLVLASLCRF